MCIIDSRQTARIRSEAAQEAAAEVEYPRQVEAGSSVDALERELLKYLLKYGHRSFEFKEGRTMVPCNVAQVIFDELADGDLKFRNAAYEKIRETYKEQWQQSGVGVEVPAHLFLNHTDPEVCNVSVDLLTSDDNYVMSELWKRKEVHVESEEEMLAVGVPKAAVLYKSKAIESMIKEQRARLADDGLSDAEQAEVLQQLTRLNNVKNTIAKRLQRSIL
ncbi:MAG: hypothetical protein K2I97_03565 [Alistipes sp.]|nr:hypothetical protein [Alistipes sp.]